MFLIELQQHSMMLARARTREQSCYYHKELTVRELTSSKWMACLQVYVGTALSLEELEEQREQCVSQISTLEAEIELLEDELRRKEGHVNDVSDEDIERAM